MLNHQIWRWLRSGLRSGKRVGKRPLWSQSSQSLLTSKVTVAVSRGGTAHGFAAGFCALVRAAGDGHKPLEWTFDLYPKGGKQCASVEFHREMQIRSGWRDILSLHAAFGIGGAGHAEWSGKRGHNLSRFFFPCLEILRCNCTILSLCHFTWPHHFAFLNHGSQDCTDLSPVWGSRANSSIKRLRREAKVINWWSVGLGPDFSSGATLCSSTHQDWHQLTSAGSGSWEQDGAGGRKLCRLEEMSRCPHISTACCSHLTILWDRLDSKGWNRLKCEKNPKDG